MNVKLNMMNSIFWIYRIDRLKMSIAPLQGAFDLMVCIGVTATATPLGCFAWNR